MKKSICIIIALICASVLVLSLTSCGETTEKKETASVSETVSEKAESSETKAESTASSKSDSSKAEASADNKLVGSWEYESGGFTYTFNDDKTGVYDVAGQKMNFTYEADGSTLSILYDGNTAPMELEYELSGDTLNVKDSTGSDTIYKRK
ncbi:MAG: hypothetical protein IJT79_06925 [Ruminococcus sp.]|nr:hypothetical protein [Ruminococcus sp.]